MDKRIALIGSSGGNLHSQGGNQPDSMVEEIIAQAAVVGIELYAIGYVCAEKSLDNKHKDINAKLYNMHNHMLRLEETGSLEDINKKAALIDREIAEDILNGKIDGLILVSSDPDGVNQESVKAAAQKGIPVVGTGGTSMSKASMYGARVIFSSGTTGTTNKIRAITYISAFSKEWKLDYKPGHESKSNAGFFAIFKRVKVRGVLMAAFPAYIALAIVYALVNSIQNNALVDLKQAIQFAIPVILSALAAKQISGMEETGLIAGIISGFLSMNGGTIGGLLSGMVTGIIVYYIVIFALRFRMPSTTVNILAGCVAGLLGGIMGYYLFAPAAQFVTTWLIWAIDWLIGNAPVLFGALVGVLIWPCVLRGLYHILILPVIFIEMGSGGFSFFGAIDMVCLVMISAGIMLANIVVPQKKNVPSAKKGFGLNIVYGTFVEAAYPYINNNRVLYAGTLLSASVFGALTGLFGIKGTAYIPSFISPLLSNNKLLEYSICIIGSLALSFMFTAFVNIIYKNKKTIKE